MDKSKVKAAWENHFEAFGTQNLEKMMIDYFEDSVINVVTVDGNSGHSKSTEHKGVEAIKNFFIGVFKMLKSDNEGKVISLEAPVILVTENVFLCWKCPHSGVAHATDTFTFKEGRDVAKISTQNVCLTLSPTRLDKVTAAWDNHFEAFGTQNIEKMMIDYVEDSVINVVSVDANSGHSKTTEHKGVEAIKKFFLSVFEMLETDKDGTVISLEAPIIIVKETVFLCWKCPHSGIKHATDTFTFKEVGDVAKISAQNVVLSTKK